MKFFKMFRKRLLTISASVSTMVLSAGVAMAGTAPAAGSLGYDFYDTAVKLTTGAPAWTIGVGGMVMAALFLFKQQLIPAGATAVGCIGVLKASSIFTTLAGSIF